jgi:hypothetical protein
MHRNDSRDCFVSDTFAVPLRLTRSMVNTRSSLFLSCGISQSVLLFTCWQQSCLQVLCEALPHIPIYFWALLLMKMTRSAEIQSSAKCTCLFCSGCWLLPECGCSPFPILTQHWASVRSLLTFWLLSWYLAVIKSAFLVTDDMDYLFMFLLAFQMSSLEEKAILTVYFLLGSISSKISLDILDMTSSDITYEYFIPFCELSFHYLDGVLWMAIKKFVMNSL